MAIISSSPIMLRAEGEGDDANVEHAFADLQLHRSEQRFAISL